MSCYYDWILKLIHLKVNPLFLRTVQVRNEKEEHHKKVKITRFLSFSLQKDPSLKKQFVEADAWKVEKRVECTESSAASDVSKPRINWKVPEKSKHFRNTTDFFIDGENWKTHSIIIKLQCIFLRLTLRPCVDKYVLWIKEKEGRGLSKDLDYFVSLLSLE